VGLAPVAALLLLMGQDGGPLRIAAVLAILAVVLIGLSITLRSSSETVRVELEDTLYEEIDALRNDMREDVATAARATHKSFSEKLQALYEQVTALRVQLDALRAEAGRGGYDPAATGQVMASGPATELGWAGLRGSQAHSPPSPGLPVGNAQPSTTGAGSWAPAGRTAGPGGVVRHTETVQVTTRQTIVDPPADDDDRGSGTVYGGGSVYGRAAQAADSGWADQRQFSGEGRRSQRYERDEEPAGDDRWSDVRSGDRWASVRDDDRGREMRMGERRAAVHSDGTGTELRYEDRWAAVRRDDPRRDDLRRDEPRRDEPRRDEPRRDEPRRDDRGGWREADAGGWREPDTARVDAGRGWRDDDRGGRADDRGWRGGQSDWRADERTGWGGESRDEPRTGGWGIADGRDEPRTGGWGDQRGGWEDDGRRAGRPEQARSDNGWSGQRPGPAALPAGGVPNPGIWDDNWVEPERQPVSGGWRGQRDDDAGYRYAPQPEDRWR